VINPSDYIKSQFSKIENENDSFILNWKVPLDLPYFTGHFPSNPILPAVAILDISIEIVKMISNDPSLEIKTIKMGKFYEIIAPNRNIQIQIANKSPGEWILAWLDEAQLEKKLAKIHLFFS